jgi:small-conductance mechanosensitive channel
MFGLSPLLLKLIGVGAVALLAVAAVKYVEHQGYKKAEAKYKPQLEKCMDAIAERDNLLRGLQADADQLKAALHEQTQALGALEVQARAAATAKDRALSALAAREAALQVEIGRLTAIVVGPPANTPQEACDEAERILRNLAIERMRDN